MEPNLKQLKAAELKESAKSLQSSGNDRGAFVLYWMSIRDLIFNDLEEKNIPFHSTDSAMTNYIVKEDNSKGEAALIAYILGTKAGWDADFKEHLENKEKNKIYQKLEKTYQQLALEKHPKCRDYIELQNLLYTRARKSFACSRYIKIGIFSISVLFLFAPFILTYLNFSTPNIEVITYWILFLIICVFLIINLSKTQKSKKLYIQAERLRQFLFFKGIYENDFKEDEEAFVINEISKDLLEHNKVYKEVTEMTDNPNNYLGESEETNLKLIERFQENTFFTYMLFDRFSKVIANDIKWLIIAILSIIMTYSILLSITDFADKLLVPRTLAAIISFLFAFDYFSYYWSFKNKSSILKNIDIKLESRPNEKLTLALYDYYNSILWDAPPMKTQFFFEHVGNLNELVSNRLKKFKSPDKT